MPETERHQAEGRDALLAAIAAYQHCRNPESYASISQALAIFENAEANLTPEQGLWLERVMGLTIHSEPSWSLLAGLKRWKRGARTPTDFHNVWSCARYAGIQSRYSQIPAVSYLEHARTFYSHTDTPVTYIITGNALRQLGRYRDAEDAYLVGLNRYMDDPFLKFRLIDLWLMTYQHARAEQMLANLRARYPFALEMMFGLPVPEGAIGIINKLPPLKPTNTKYVWLIAADPVYLERHKKRKDTHVVHVTLVVR